MKLTGFWAKQKSLIKNKKSFVALLLDWLQHLKNWQEFNSSDLSGIRRNAKIVAKSQTQYVACA